MFNDLIKVIICIKEHQKENITIIDNEKRIIMFNNKLKTLSEKEYNNFVSSLFRIIREWYNKENYKANTRITIIEKENQYELCIDDPFPNNYDNFLALINNLNN